MTRKNTARNIVATAITAMLTFGFAAAPALADEYGAVEWNPTGECGDFDITPIEHSDCALLPAEYAVEIAVQAAPVSGWEEVSNVTWSFNFFSKNYTYRVEVWNTQGRWWEVWVDAKSGEVLAVL